MRGGGVACGAEPKLMLINTLMAFWDSPLIAFGLAAVCRILRDFRDEKHMNL
jgi:hypothetical protein